MTIQKSFQKSQKSRKKTKLALSVAVLLILKGRRNHQKRWENRELWQKTWIGRRNFRGNFTLLKELEAEDPSGYRTFLRMTKDNFDEILKLVRPYITKEDTKLREAISAEKRLIITLRFLATGESFQSLYFQFRVGRSTISELVEETCQALFDAMRDKYMKMPDTAEEWQKIATDFETKWNYPYCIGAIDGKHFKIKNPDHAGSLYYNYKNYFSVVLLALVDANYKFRYVCCGAPGRNGDAGIYRNSPLKTAIDTGQLNIPPTGKLNGSDDLCNFHIVGDDAFPLGTHMMKPYPHRNLERDKVLFNIRFCRARRVVENGFGILASRFRVFQGQIELEPKKVTKLIVASCCLHNFLVEKNARFYISNLVDPQGRLHHTAYVLPGLESSSIRNPTVGAKTQRENLKKYFQSPVGRVPWQDKAVDRKLRNLEEETDEEE